MIELRADGSGPGIVTGTVVAYGAINRVMGVPERIATGAFAPLGDVLANRQHRRELTLGRTGHGLELEDTDTALLATLRLPDTVDGRDTAELIRSGILQGLSGEFRVMRDVNMNGIREIRQAQLFAVSVVDKPAYREAKIDSARQDRTRPVVRLWEL